MTRARNTLVDGASARPDLPRTSRTGPREPRPAPATPRIENARSAIRNSARAIDCFGSSWPRRGGTGARRSCSSSPIPWCDGIANGSAGDGRGARRGCVRAAQGPMSPFARW